MVFDWTINFGHVLTFLTLCGAVLAGYYAVKADIRIFSTLMGERMQLLSGRIINIETDLKELTRVSISLAETNVKIQNLDNRLTEQTRRINNIDEYGSKNLNVILSKLEFMDKSSRD